MGSMEWKEGKLGVEGREVRSGRKGVGSGRKGVMSGRKGEKTMEERVRIKDVSS